MVAIIIIVLIIIIVAFFMIRPERFAGRPSRRPVLITGSMHGDEPAGGIALREMIRDGEFDRYKDALDIKVIPVVNPWGFEHGRRMTRDGIDLNREFAGLRPHSTIAGIKKMVSGWRGEISPITIDLHEGWGWKRDGLGSIGSSIYHSNPDDRDLAHRVARSVGFEVLLPSDTLPGTYSEWRRRSDPSGHHFLVETTGKFDVQPLRKRVAEHKKIVRGLLDGFVNPDG